MFKRDSAYFILKNIPGTKNTQAVALESDILLHEIQF